MDTYDLLRPGKRPYIVFLIIFSAPITIGIFISIFISQTAIKGVICFLLLAACFNLWIYLHVIYLYSEKIIYYSLLGGKKIILIDEISRWSIRIGIFKYLDRFKPTVRLEIESSNPENKPIIIAIKLFNKEDIDKLLNLLPADKEEKQGSFVKMALEP